MYYLFSAVSRKEKNYYCAQEDETVSTCKKSVECVPTQMKETYQTDEHHEYRVLWGWTLAKHMRERNIQTDNTYVYRDTCNVVITIARCYYNNKKKTNKKNEIRTQTLFPLYL